MNDILPHSSTYIQNTETLFFRHLQILCTPMHAKIWKNVTLNQLVLGSSPSAPTNEFKQKGQSSRIGLFAFLLYAGVT